jgi:hypothetical protein
MIRFILGILLVFGVVGGMDNMPTDPTYSYLFWQGVFVTLGFGLAISGVNSMRS